MNEDLIWFDSAMDELDDEDSELEWTEDCEHFENGECLQMGAPCPVKGNSASYSCLMTEEGTQMLEAS